MSGAEALIFVALKATIALVEAAMRGDLTARERLLEILGPSSRSYAERLLDEAAIARGTFGGQP